MIVVCSSVAVFMFDRNTWSPCIRRCPAAQRTTKTSALTLSHQTHIHKLTNTVIWPICFILNFTVTVWAIYGGTSKVHISLLVVGFLFVFYGFLCWLHSSYESQKCRNKQKQTQNVFAISIFCVVAVLFQFLLCVFFASLSSLFNMSNILLMYSTELGTKKIPHCVFQAWNLITFNLCIKFYWKVHQFCQINIYSMKFQCVTEEKKINHSFTRRISNVIWLKFVQNKRKNNSHQHCLKV